MVILLTLENGRQEVVNLPSRADPQAVAEAHGAVLFDLRQSEDDAQRRIAADPNGWADSI